MLRPPFDPDQWTDTDLRRTLASLHTRFRWTVEGWLQTDDDGPERTEAVAALITDLAELQAANPPEALERHELELAVVRGEAILREAASVVVGAVPHPGGPGRVAGLFRSDGGVPKLPVDRVEVGWRGVVGDRQANRTHHGRLWQALCLWSAEVVEALQAEGHPISPGTAGENVSVSGLDWSALRPGQQLELGSVVVELTAWSAPCTKNSRWFADGDSGRIDHERHPGWSRIYASVLREGAVAIGDPVTFTG